MRPVGGEAASRQDQIEYVIFDLGGVLIEIHPEKMLAALSACCGGNPQKLQNDFFGETHRQFMSGWITPQKFHSWCVEQFDLQLDFSRFAEIWQMTLGKIRPEVFALVDKLAARCRLAIASNTDILHWQFVAPQLPGLARFRRVFLSFQMGICKPQTEFFRQVISTLNCRPSACLFIDDSAKNIVAASQMGFATHLFGDGPQLARPLLEMGLLNSGEL